MASFIDFLFEPPWVYLIMVAAIIGGLWWVLKRYGLLPTSAATFKGQTLTQIIQDENLKRMTDVFGNKIKNAKLTLHFRTIKIGRITRVPVKISIREEISLGKFRKKKYKFLTKDKTFLIFKKGGGFFEEIPVLKLIHTKAEYFVVEDEDKYVKKDPNSNLWTLSPNTFPHLFAGVWVVSMDGVAFLTELAYKKMQENDKEESVNALKRFIFYNDHHTARIVAMERKQELKDESWDKSKKAVDQE